MKLEGEQMDKILKMEWRGKRRKSRRRRKRMRSKRWEGGRGGELG